jgi:hypothetical protein
MLRFIARNNAKKGTEQRTRPIAVSGLKTTTSHLCQALSRIFGSMGGKGRKITTRMVA